MKKFILLSVPILLFGLTLFGDPVDEIKATNVAINWYEFKNPIEDSEIAKMAIKEYNGHHSYYIFNFSSGGFVIVPADDAA